MEEARMSELVCQHLEAEGAGDVEGAVAVYTDDVDHDVVGFPGSPSVGRDGARAFYRELTSSFRTEREQVLHQYRTADALIIEQQMTGTVIGTLFGLPGNDRRITFRTLHVFEFRDDLISRENVWLDSGAVIGQLS